MNQYNIAISIICNLPAVRMTILKCQIYRFIKIYCGERIFNITNLQI